jgi:hypothetical protein
MGEGRSDQGECGDIVGPPKVMVKIWVFDQRVILNLWQFPGRGVKESDVFSGLCKGKSGVREAGWEAAAQKAWL